MRRIDITRQYRESDQNEFYTPLDTVQLLLEKYGYLLNGKRVHCPADDGGKSYFYKELKAQYTKLNLKGLVATGYVENDHGIRYTFDGQTETMQELHSDGSYLSDESLEVTNNWADAIVTNPPFTKYSRFWGIIKEKTFIVIAPYIVFTQTRLSEVWAKALDKEIYLDDTLRGMHGQNGKVSRVICMATGFPYNIEPKQTQIELTKKFDHNIYDEYLASMPDVLCVDKLKDIPYDYTGKMAVPLGALYHIYANQYKIIGGNGTDKFKKERIDYSKHYLILTRAKHFTNKSDHIKFFRFVIQLLPEYIEQRKKEMQDILNKKENKNEKENNN